MEKAIDLNNVIREAKELKRVRKLDDQWEEQVFSVLRDLKRRIAQIEVDRQIRDSRGRKEAIFKE